MSFELHDPAALPLPPSSAPLPPSLLGVLPPREMLKRARDQFQSYGDQHTAKSPPQVEKAATNYNFVAAINATLLQMSSQIVRSPDVNQEKTS